MAHSLVHSADNNPIHPHIPCLMTPDLHALLQKKIFDPRNKAAKERYPVTAQQAASLHQQFACPGHSKLVKALDLLYKTQAVDDPGICLLGHCLQTIGTLQRKRLPFKGKQKNNPLHGLVQSAAQERKDLENLAKTVKLLQQQLQVCNMDLPMVLALDPSLAGVRLDAFNDLAIRAERSDDGLPSIKHISSANSRAPSDLTLGQLLAQVVQQAQERVNSGKVTRRLLTGVNRRNAHGIYVIRRLDQFWCQEMQLPRSEECLAEISTLVLEQLGLGPDQSAQNGEDVRSALKGWKSEPLAPLVKLRA